MAAPPHKTLSLSPLFTLRFLQFCNIFRVSRGCSRGNVAGVTCFSSGKLWPGQEIGNLELIYLLQSQIVSYMYILKGPQQEIAYNLAIFKGVHLTCILKPLSSKKLMDSLISTDHSYRRWMSRWLAMQGNRGLSSLCGETVTAENFRTFFSRTAKITRRTAKTRLQQKGAQSLLQDNFFPCEKRLTFINRFNTLPLNDLFFDL